MPPAIKLWCPGRDLNPHFPCGKTDFKSVASADFATRAFAARLWDLRTVAEVCPSIMIVKALAFWAVYFLGVHRSRQVRSLMSSLVILKEALIGQESQEITEVVREAFLFNLAAVWVGIISPFPVVGVWGGDWFTAYWAGTSL